MQKDKVEFELLLPEFCVNKVEDTLVGEFKTNKLDLSTIFMLTEYKNCVIFEVRILGLGFKLYYTWSNDE